RIKGDTTEFIADSFHVREGATVEELLKKLPGIQVNSKGEITAQGQKVGKVLVDGEEFFGDDPTMATQNIGARAVDKVQVYDTKTDQQNLTGISTGSEGKTVNIKLKESSKKGSFGKAHFGTDFQKLVDAKALYNKFVGKRKLSLYGTKSDVSTGSLNWEDKQKLGIENDFEYDEISGYYYSFGSGDEFNDWSLRGLPNSYTAGALFSDKWADDKYGINGSYRYNRLGTENTASTQQQNLLTNSISYKNKIQNTDGLNQQHTGNIKYEWKPDSLTSFKFSSVLTYKKTDLLSDAYEEFLLGESKNLVRQTYQNVDNHSEKKQADNQLTYRQAFKKPNRLLMTTLRFGIVEDDQEGIIYTKTNFYKTGNAAIDSIDIGDQLKLRNGDSKTLGGKITWSEPFSAKWSLVMEYAFNKNNSTSLRSTFNKDVSDKYQDLDTKYSNNFELEAFSHTGSAIFRYTGKKLRAAFGTGTSSVRLNLFSIDSNRRSQYYFLKLTPQASFSYVFAPQTRLSLNYRGSTRQPSIDQLQPIRDNSDRSNIIIGNPFLKVTFNHNINLNFNTYKMLSQKGLFAGLGFNIPVNAITYFNVLDVTKGVQTSTPVNVRGNYNWNFYSDYFKDGQGKLGYGVNLGGSGGRNNNFTNGLPNTTNYFNSNLELSLRYSKEEKYSFSAGPKLGYNDTKSSTKSSYDNSYWNYGGDIDGRITFLKKYELSSEVEIDLRQNLQQFAGNPNQTIWNASLSRKVFKDNSGKIYIVANDILDQKKGFNRNITSNYVTEERYSRISRYFLLKFEWSFNKMPGQVSNK
ncbi:MAG: outer membrane beta-barrel protein, partial [Flavisolibacter sp.]